MNADLTETTCKLDGIARCLEFGVGLVLEFGGFLSFATLH